MAVESPGPRGGSMSGTGEEKRLRARHLAAGALHAAIREDWPAASRAMQAISTETGGAGTTAALVAWCDTLITVQRRAAGLPGEPAPGEVTRPGWLDAGTGQVTLNAGDVPPAVQWAGQLVAARAALDLDGFNALLTAMPEDRKARGDYAGALLHACAATARGRPRGRGRRSMTRAFSAAWQIVTCRACGRSWTCTPEDDYYNAENATSGVCHGCLLAESGLNPETTPVRVIDLTGAGTDPRDLSRSMNGTGEQCSPYCGYVSSGGDLLEHQRWEHARCTDCGAEPHDGDSVTHSLACPRLQPGHIYPEAAP